MDPELKSIVTTILGYACASAATWAAGIGIIPSSEQGSFANVLVTVILGAGAVAIGWYKKQQQTKAAMAAALAATKPGQDAMALAINVSNNGAKVVPDNASTAGISAIDRVPMLGAVK
jgi:hypothetical protein